MQDILPEKVDIGNSSARILQVQQLEFLWYPCAAELSKITDITEAETGLLLTATAIVTIQPAELLRHPAMENRFAMGRMAAGATLSYGLRRPG